MQKAYLVGRTEVLDGFSGTHLYIELIYKGAIEELNLAFNKVIAQQPMMRARVFDNEYLEIQNNLNYQIEVLAGDSSDFEVSENIRKELSHKKYQASDFPLFTMKALGEENKYKIFFSIDLMIADGLSLYMLMEQLVAALKEKTDFQNCDERILEMNEFYQDIRNSEKFEKAKRYYLKNLENLYYPPQLKYKLVDKKTAFFNRKEFELSESDYIKLKEKAQNYGVSVTDILLTIYAMILAKWSKENQMTINVTSFIRPKGDLYKNVIGDFTTSLPLQANYNFYEPFLENINKIKSSMFNSWRYRQFEMTDIIRELDKKEKGHIMPVVFTAMLFENNNLFEEIFSLEYWISQTPQVYLDYQAKNISGKLNISWDYRNDIFDEYLIQQMFEDYKNVLNLVVKYELKDIDTNQLLYADVKESYRIYNKQSERLEVQKEKLKTYWKRQIDNNPKKIFIVSKSTQYSFEEINTRAMILAGKIKQCKTGKTRIALEGKKEISTIVGVIAAILSDNSFCIVNNRYGRDKKKEILNTLGNYIYVDNEDIIEKSCDSTEISCSESYILYTSGTTGQPKGIIISEQAALNTVHAINKMLNMKKEDVILNISNLYFDLSIYDFFASIIVGMKVFLLDIYESKWFFENNYFEEITFWNSTPALAEEILLKYEFKSLRNILLSGDFVSKRLVEKLYQSYRKINVVALGGATEASIWSNYYNCETHNSVKTIPYGKPLANQELYIINSSGMVSPQDVLGEICISGLGLAEGYIDPIQTKEAFIFNEELKKRVYRTGDLGFLGRDNNIYIIGRVKNEIKHNGYRIDLKEIEKTIEKIDGVKKAVVYIEKMDNGRTKLVCVAISQIEEMEKVIREQLSEKLPDYMTPTNYYHINEIPLTNNGKIDLKTIKQYVDQHIEICEFSKEEKEIVSLWKKCIGQDFKMPLSPHDTFFDLGGQSLRILEMKEILDEYFNIDIALQDVLTNISVRTMTAHIKKIKSNDSSKRKKNLILIREGTSQDKNIVIIHSGSGEVNIYENLSKYLDKEYSIYAIKFLDSSLEKLAVREIDFKKLAEEYDEILEKFEKIDYIGGWCIGGTIAYEMSLLNHKKYRKVFLINSLPPQERAIEKFDISFSSEFKLVERFFDKEEKIYFQEKRSKQEIWEKLVQKIRLDEKCKKMYFRLLPEQLKKLIPNISSLPEYDLIYYVNLLRSFERARYLYQSNQKTEAEIHCYNATDEPVEQLERWELYAKKIEKINVKGDHISIFFDENVKEFADEINKRIRNI